jgi:predicted ribosome quality control (RQC) complex YloA/Tae2 family protein
LRGELILANLDRLRTGMESAELTGPDGAAVMVPLDPLKGPAANADAWFRRYKKAKAALAVVRERLDDAREEAEVIGLAQEELARTADSDRLAALRSRLATIGLIAGRGGGRTARPAAAAPFRTIDVDGWEVLVGTSAAGNDYLTTTIARPDDLWLHAEGMPGSHVVVRNPRKADVPPAVLKRAASLAAWYSKGRGATKVPVAYTAAKYVRKPRGARTGAVVLAERKTIMAAPEPFH